MKIKELLGKKVLFFDGGMGSMLQKLGMPTGSLPEQLNIANPEMIIEVHKQYLEAGADIITTNTFGAYSTKFGNCREIIQAAVSNVKKAIELTNSRDKYIALDLGSIGKLLAPLGELSFDEAYDIFKESAIYGEESGCDLVIIETISDTYEAKAAVLAVKENTNLPIICSMTFQENKKNLTGGDVVAACTLLEGLAVDCIGINCGLGPKQIESIFDDLAAHTSLPILVQPNAGIPSMLNGETVYDISEDEFALYMEAMCKKGAWLLGGCCGTTPEHTKRMIVKCKHIMPPVVTNKNLTLVSSYSKTVQIGKQPVIIGERINPTGKKKLKAALKENNIQYLIDEALSQEQAGADILDVNVGLPDINENELMLQAVKSIQAITALPLQIDSSDPNVIENALRNYNGKALINSVNGKKESMEKIFPLVKKYGGVVVALTLDENGIPETAEGRLKIAEKIISTAEAYGIDKKNIIVDTLTLTVSAQQDTAYETLTALKLVTEKLQAKTILGVSNISFGLPEREIVNSTFFAIALHNGLSACIINPLSKEMMKTIHAFNVLAGYDDGCKLYIDTYKKEVEKSVLTTQQKKQTLQDLIIKGLKEQAYDATCELLQTMDSLNIINEHIVPALDYVGSQYESQRFFLPQLIMSAEASKHSFQAINEHMKKNNTTSERKGNVVIATVEGDIHDIGKNIVVALLENYGYGIIDLGKDVSVETVVDAAVKYNAKLVGLSALMTTTVVNMEKTILRLRETCPDCKIMVGGAVLNEDYAKKIDADYYCKDALAAVKVCKEILN